MSIRSKINLTIPEKIANGLEYPTCALKVEAVNAADTSDGVAELIVSDVIGDEFFGDGNSTLKGVARFLADADGNAIRVLIDSPGGYALTGAAMYNLLANYQGDVTVRVVGLAASAASIIAMAGDKIQMYENTSLVIHRAWSLAIGNTDAMMETAEYLDQIDQGLASVYSARTGKSVDEILEMMAGKGKSDGTAFTPKQALDYGLIDEVLPMKKGKQSKNVVEKPKNVQARLRRLVADEKEAIAFLQ